MTTPPTDEQPNYAPKLHDFDRCMNAAARKDFYSNIRGSRWWVQKAKGKSKPAWPTIFDQTDWRCVYCHIDLTTSTDALAESTEEHLVPRSLLEENSAEPNTSENMACCCAACNGLKGDYLPPTEDTKAWECREEYIKSCSKFIAKRRLDNLKAYLPNVIKVLEKRAGYKEGRFTKNIINSKTK